VGGELQINKAALLERKVVMDHFKENWATGLPARKEAIAVIHRIFIAEDDARFC